MHVVWQGGIAAVFQGNFFTMYCCAGKSSKIFAKKEFAAFRP